MAAEQPVARIVACDCITPFGDAKDTAASLSRGESALRATPVLGKDGGDKVPLALLPGRALDETTPPAWIDALRRLVAPIVDGGWGSPRRPICVASSNYGVGSLYAYRRTGEREHLHCGAPDTCVRWVFDQFGWGENVAIFSHACVTAHVAVQHATRLLDAGVADQVLVFAFDFLSPFVAAGFHSLKILNAEFPAPYQARPIGAIGLGDGAAYAVLSRTGGDFAITGQSLYNEMFHPTANEPSGSGFAAVFGPLPLAGRRLWVKGHGTGTLDAGRLESGAVAKQLPGAPLVGWKGALGHTLGSCGLIELAIALAAMRGGEIPGTVGSARPTFEDNVALDSFAADRDGVLCLSNAFGGAHAALLVTYA
jgi:hypothetical protein